ncbi:hypothetical protein P9112_004120 [Eukaryota sp. TZLM1-RC]
MEDSPYLQQHETNPIQWMSWDHSTISKAKNQDKLIFLSIGYSTCHWCHVMNRECFSQQEVAESLLPFMCIKVDREACPDVDLFYITAASSIQGTAGWPCNLFLTSNLHPFYTFTYLPKPELIELCNRVSNSDLREYESIGQSVYEATISLLSLSSPFASSLSSLCCTKELDNAIRRYRAVFTGPRFVPFELLRLCVYDGNPHGLSFCKDFVLNLISSGTYDQLGDGVFRYATDLQWKVPHFEKMLYDQAQLLLILALLYNHDQDSLLLNVIHRLISFLNREMRLENGLYCCGVDAEDLTGCEGAFYQWTRAEVVEVLEVGGLDERTISEFLVLFTANEEMSNPFLTKLYSQLTDRENTLLGIGKNLLFKARQDRLGCKRDEKCLLSWNSLLLWALAAVGKATKNTQYIEQACQLAESLLSTFNVFDSPCHSFYHGKCSFDTTLEDLGYLLRGLVALINDVDDVVDLLDECAQIRKIILADFQAKDNEAILFYNSKKSLIPRISKCSTKGNLPNPFLITVEALVGLVNHGIGESTTVKKFLLAWYNEESCRESFCCSIHKFIDLD